MQRASQQANLFSSVKKCFKSIKVSAAQLTEQKEEHSQERRQRNRGKQKCFLDFRQKNINDLIAFGGSIWVSIVWTWRSWNEKE